LGQVNAPEQSLDGLHDSRAVSHTGDGPTVILVRRAWGSRVGLVALDEAAGLYAVEVREGLVEVMVGDLIGFDVEAVEDRLVEQAPLLVVAPAVQLLGVFQQFQAHLDEAGAVGEIVVGVAKTFRQVSALPCDVPEPGLDLRLGKRVVSGKVDEVVFSDVQRA
jgi:hypothetical protein